MVPAICGMKFASKLVKNLLSRKLMRDEVVRHLGRIVAILPQSERVILWLNTYAGETLGRDG